MQDLNNISFRINDTTGVETAGGTLRIKLEKKKLGGAGGTVSRIDVADCEGYLLQFDMMFDKDFDFSKGGKVGFGFLLGEGYTGGGPAHNGKGGECKIDVA